MFDPDQSQSVAIFCPGNVCFTIDNNYTELLATLDPENRVQLNCNTERLQFEATQCTKHEILSKTIVYFLQDEDFILECNDGFENLFQINNCGIGNFSNEHAKKSNGNLTCNCSINGDRRPTDRTFVLKRDFEGILIYLFYSKVITLIFF